MRRLWLLVCFVPLMAACATDTNFNIEGDGVCYRTRTEKILWVIPVGKQTVQAVQANCEGGGL